MPIALASGLPQTFAGLAGAVALVVATPFVVSADTHATLGAPGVEVPNVVGLQEADATAALAELGFAFESSRAFDDEIEAGLVYSSLPLAGTWIDAGGAVHLEVSDGPRMVEVPDFALLTAADAREAGNAQDGPTVVVQEEYSDDVVEGALISQDVPTGTSVRHDSFVNVVYSSGLEPVVIPDVTGRSKSSAIDVLKSKGLKVTVKEQSSGSVDKGDVIKQSPKGGADGHRTDTVTIWVSTGLDLAALFKKNSATMRAVVGMTESQARAYARARGIPSLVVAYTSGPLPDSVVPGKVINAGCEPSNPTYCHMLVGEKF